MRLENNRKKIKRLRLNARKRLKAAIRKDILSGRLKRVPLQFREVIKFECPSELSLDRNFDATIGFFRELKELSNQIVTRRAYRKTQPVHYSIGLQNLEVISIRCAVIFAAEIDRLRRIAGDELDYKGKAENDKEPISLLRQLGLFRLVGIRREEEVNLPPKVAHGHRTAIPLMSGLNCDEQRIVSFYQAVETILVDFQTTDFFHVGMVEAMLNATNHAYLSEFLLQYPSCGKRWWAAAALDTECSELKLLVFDQGHGIARTLPSSGLIESIELTIAKLLGKIVSFVDTPEEILVKAALDTARTRTNDDERGQGFKDIQAAVFEVEGARLRIASGRAEVTLQYGNDTVSKRLPYHIGGTLIEWAFPVQSVQQHETEVA